MNQNQIAAFESHKACERSHEMTGQHQIQSAYFARTLEACRGSTVVLYYGGACDGDFRRKSTRKSC